MIFGEIGFPVRDTSRKRGPGGYRELLFWESFTDRVRNQGKAYIPFRQAGVTTSLLSIPDEKTHSQYRKLVSNAYSMTSLKGYEPYVDEMVNRFVEVCNEHAESQAPMNLSLWCHYCELSPGMKIVGKKVKKA